jgi:RNA polymerase sigma-70 factor (sigma-E family)
VDPEAERDYGDFVVARSQALCRMAYLLCGDWHRAEDAVQTALAKLYVSWQRIRDRGAVDGYVRRVVVTTLIDEGRLARFRREALPGRLPEPAHGADLAGTTGDRLAVLAALARVPPRQRAVLVLRYWEDQSVEQVAELLGCSPGTVKSQSARGLQTLRELLDDEVTAQV